MANPQIEDGYTKIANELLNALSRANLQSSDFMICLSVISKTYGWNKKQDKISISQFQILTGMSRQRCIHSINRLVLYLILGRITGNTNTSATYWIQKDYDKWHRPGVMGNPSITCNTTGGITADKKVVLRVTPTQYNNKRQLKTAPINQVKELKEKPIHVIFIENFSIWYEKASGFKYSSNKEDYVICANLIKKFTLPVVELKSNLLLKACADKSLWFTKDGYSSFNIKTLSNKWNEIIDNSKLKERFI